MVSPFSICRTVSTSNWNIKIYDTRLFSWNDWTFSLFTDEKQKESMAKQSKYKVKHLNSLEKKTFNPNGRKLNMSIRHAYSELFYINTLFMILKANQKLSFNIPLSVQVKLYPFKLGSQTHFFMKCFATTFFSKSYDSLSLRKSLGCECP